jgi:hypothetical protein
MIGVRKAPDQLRILQVLKGLGVKTEISVAYFVRTATSRGKLRKEVFNGTSQTWQEPPNSPLWYLWDGVYVLINLIMLFVLAAPTAVLAVWTENERRKDGLAKWASVEQLLWMSWNFPQNLAQMHLIAKVLFGVSIFIFGFGILESIRFYLTYAFEVSEAENPFCDKHSRNIQSYTNNSTAGASVVLSSTRAGVRSNAAFEFVSEAVLPTDAVIHITFPLMYRLAPRRALGREDRPVGMDGVLKVLSCNESEIVFQRCSATKEVPPHHRVAFKLPCRALCNPTMAGTGARCTDIVGLVLKASVDGFPNLPPAGYIEISRVLGTNGTARLIAKKGKDCLREVPELTEDGGDDNDNWKDVPNSSGFQSHRIDLDRKHVSLLCKASGNTKAITDVKICTNPQDAPGDAEWNASSGNANLSEKDKSGKWVGQSDKKDKTWTFALHARYGGILLSARSAVSAKHMIQEHAIESPTIQPGRLSKVAVTPHSWWPEVVTSATITFRLGNDLPPGGLIDIDLPPTHKIKYKNVVSTSQQDRKDFYKELNGEDAQQEDESTWSMSRFWFSTNSSSSAPLVTEDGMEVDYSIQVPRVAGTNDASTHILLARTFKGGSAIPRGTLIHITLPSAFFKNPPLSKSRKKHRQPCSIHTKTARDGSIIDAVDVHFRTTSTLSGLLFRSGFLGAVLMLIVLIAFYLSLVCIWWVLGAVLNPAAYLPYAATVTTFVSYAYGNIRATRVRFKDIQKRLMSRVKGHLEQKLQANLVKLGLSEMTPGMVGLLTELHDVNYHVDAVVASKLASCEATAVDAFADSQGIPASTISLIIAIFRHDKDATAKALAELIRSHVAKKSPVAERDSRELVPAMYRFMAFMDGSNSHEQEAAITDILEITGWKSGHLQNSATKSLINDAMQKLKDCKLAPSVYRVIDKHLYRIYSREEAISMPIKEKENDEADKKDVGSNEEAKKRENDKTDKKDVGSNEEAKKRGNDEADKKDVGSNEEAKKRENDEADKKDVGSNEEAKKRGNDEAAKDAISKRNEKLKQARSKRAKDVKVATKKAAAAMKLLVGAFATDRGTSEKRQALDDLLLDAVFALAEGETRVFMQYLRMETTLTAAQEQLLRRMAETRAPSKQQAQVKSVVDDPTTLATISLDQIFSVVDADDSGYVDPSEFAQALRAMGVSVTDERALQIFSRCDKDHSGLLGRREFAQAVEKLQKHFVRHLMRTIGMGRLRLTAILITLIAAIFLVLVFIYLGVKAFGTGDEFAAVINSILPISTGLLMGFAQQIGAVDIDRVLHHLVSGCYSFLCISSEVLSLT